MGYKVFSLGGVYQNENLGDNLRGSIPNFVPDPELGIIPQTKDNVHPDLVNWADIIIVTHNHPAKEHPQPWIANNWKLFKESKKPIIWRSIGQSNELVEESLKKFRKEGLKIVRYSPKEETIPSYQGSDALIRFYASPVEYDGYIGNIARLVNISQALFGGPNQNSRGDHMNLKEFKQIVEGSNWKVFGKDNENAGEHNGGVLSYEDLKSMLRFNRAYVYVGTRPAYYTLGFIEAWMTGIPIISIGNYFGNSIYTNQKTFEVPDLIGENGVAGFYSDSINDLRDYCKQLLEDQELAKKIGQAGRIKAIEYFGKDIIEQAWKDFFKIL